MRLVPAVNLLALLFWPRPSLAHVSETGFVLLLPTNLYISAGVAAVVLTVLAIALVPASMADKLFRPCPIRPIRLWPMADAISLVCTALLAALIFWGFTGTRDPLENPLPLVIWTLWWIVLPVLQGLLGDLWSALNPWTGLYRRLRPESPAWRLPAGVGFWPAGLMLVLFAMFMLADPAPDQPARLAGIVAAYWLVTLGGMLIFGERWLECAEFYTVLMRLIARLAPLRAGRGGARLGVPGWGLLRAAPAGLGYVALAYLAIGSFDGFNETFTWLGWIGVNPLEFPGRSAVMGITVTGLLASHLALFAAFGACIALGLSLAKGDVMLSQAFGPLALTTLPIAFAYHVAHYLVSALINLQYVALALRETLGLGSFYVTTGFLNSKASVDLIFRVQAGSVVIGHVIAVLLAHAVAMRLLGDRRRAVLSQVPLAIFMIAYTFLGLWLLAAPKGA